MSPPIRHPPGPRGRPALIASPMRGSRRDGGPSRLRDAPLEKGAPCADYELSGWRKSGSAPMLARSFNCSIMYRQVSRCCGAWTR